MSDDRFDLAIDRAVRDMLDVEQRAGLRARVLRRIEQGEARSSGRSRVGWLLLPLAAAVVVILAIELPSRTTPAAQPPVAVARVEPPAAPVAPAPRIDSPLVAPAPHQRVVADSRRPGITAAPERVVIAATFGEAENATTDIQPLRTMTPIQVTPLSHDTIAPAEIAVRPLTPITEVQVAPLSPPDRRN